MLIYNPYLLPNFFTLFIVFHHGTIKDYGYYNKLAKGIQFVYTQWYFLNFSNIIPSIGEIALSSKNGQNRPASFPQNYISPVFLNSTSPISMKHRSSVSNAA